MSFPLIEFADLSQAYGDFVALSGLRGALPPGSTGLGG